MPAAQTGALPVKTGLLTTVMNLVSGIVGQEPAEAQSDEARAMPSAPHLPPESAGAAEPVAAAGAAGTQDASSGAISEQPAVPQQLPESPAPAVVEAGANGGSHAESPAADAAKSSVSDEPAAGNGGVNGFETEGNNAAAADALPQMPEGSAAPAAPAADEAAAAAFGGASSNGPSESDAPPLETSASVADAADAIMLGEDIPVPETVAESAAESPEASSTAAGTSAVAEVPPRPAALHSVPVSQPQDPPPPSMAHAHSRCGPGMAFTCGCVYDLVRVMCHKTLQHNLPIADLISWQDVKMFRPLSSLKRPLQGPQPGRGWWHVQQRL